MKKILFLTAILNSLFAFPQCTIMGADQLQVGERQVYTSSNNNAECDSCYKWTYLDQNIILEGDLQKSQLTLKGSLPGDALLSLEIKTNSSPEKCEKLIKVIEPTSNIITNKKGNCDIKLNSFNEIRVADKKVSFQPENTEEVLSYKWTVYYRGGETKESAEKKPEFDYSNDQVIDKVEMTVTLEHCNKTITKLYDTNFWYFF